MDGAEFLVLPMWLVRVIVVGVLVMVLLSCASVVRYDCCVLGACDGLSVWSRCFVLPK